MMRLVRLIRSGEIDSVFGRSGVIVAEPGDYSKSDVGLGNVDNTADADKPVSAAQAAAIQVVEDLLEDHEADTGNPHAVTKAQVGLDQVDNTSDLEKPLSYQSQAALDNRVIKNANITPGTKTKVTYDAKGLVTAGDDATTADIADSLNKRYVTDAEKTAITHSNRPALDLVSGANTGDETNSSIKTKLGAATAGNDGYATAAQITKLDGIQAGAEVNVNPDWNAVGGDAEILNKPTSFPPSSHASSHTDGSDDIQTANGSQKGLLSSSDWNTFNAKQAALGFTPENSANKGVAGGYASLDGTGKVPAAQLPSYVDDALEYADLASFPVTGETGKIYVALDTNRTYRWTGSIYVEISASEVTSVNGATGAVSLTTNEIPSSLNKRYVSDADLTNLSNLSGVNSGDEVSATDVLEGVVELATQAEVNTGTDPNRVVTAQTLESKTLGTFTGVTIPNDSTLKQALQSLETEVEGKEDALGFTPEDSANKSNDGALTANSAVLFPTQQAVKTYADTKVAANPGVTGATKTKITYDAKGLVTAGADATTADIPDSSDKRYVTNSDLVNLGNLSGVNSGDEVSASESVEGVAELATQAEVNAGADTLRIVTPATLANKTLGTFTGSTIPDDSTTKQSLQALETAVELKEALSNKAVDFSVVNDTRYPTVQAVKTYADALVVGLLDDRGNYDASSNLFPSTGGSGTAGAILKGDLWTISVAGVLGGSAVTAGDVVRALVDSPGQTASNWAVTENNFGYVAENQANKSTDGTLAANSDTLYPTQQAVKTYADTKVAANAPIVGDTFTKITFDEKGLITAGANATTADIDNSADKNYVTDADLVNLGNLSGVNSGDQTITLTGDVTGSGTGSFAATIADNAVTNAKSADMATQTLKGRITASTGDPEDLTAAQARTLLNVEDGATANAKATAAELNTGTDDVKFATALGLENSKYVTQNGVKLYAVASGTNTYTATLTPALSAYAAGNVLHILFTNGNTSVSSLNVNGLGAKSIVKGNGQTLIAGDILSGEIISLGYNGTDFQILGRRPPSYYEITANDTVNTTSLTLIPRPTTPITVVPAAGVYQVIASANVSSDTNNNGCAIQLRVGGVLIANSLRYSRYSSANNDRNPLTTQAIVTVNGAVAVELYVAANVAGTATFYETTMDLIRIS